MQVLLHPDGEGLQLFQTPAGLRHEQHVLVWQLTVGAPESQGQLAEANGKRESGGKFELRGARGLVQDKVLQEGQAGANGRQAVLG